MHLKSNKRIIIFIISLFLFSFNTVCAFSYENVTNNSAYVVSNDVVYVNLSGDKYICKDDAFDVYSAYLEHYGCVDSLLDSDGLRSSFDFTFESLYASKEFFFDSLSAGFGLSDSAISAFPFALDSQNIRYTSYKSAYYSYEITSLNYGKRYTEYVYFDDNVVISDSFDGSVTSSLNNWTYTGKAKGFYFSVSFINDGVKLSLSVLDDSGTAHVVSNALLPFGYEGFVHGSINSFNNNLPSSTNSYGDSSFPNITPLLDSANASDKYSYPLPDSVVVYKITYENDTPVVTEYIPNNDSSDNGSNDDTLGDNVSEDGSYIDNLELPTENKPVEGSSILDWLMYWVQGVVSFVLSLLKMLLKVFTSLFDFLKSLIDITSDIASIWNLLFGFLPPPIPDLVVLTFSCAIVISFIHFLK